MLAKTNMKLVLEIFFFIFSITDIYLLKKTYFKALYNYRDLIYKIVDRNYWQKKFAVLILNIEDKKFFAYITPFS